MNATVTIEVDVLEAASELSEDETLELIKHIDEEIIADTGFSVKLLGQLFESLTNDITKKELLEFLETGSEAAIKTW
jgi:hypothetical protein